LLSESLATNDETLTQTTRECGLLSLQKKIPSPLKSLGISEHVTTLSLPTPTGYCTFDYMFANTKTGEIVRALVPPLLLSTHDPDTAYRESCYRGDPKVDLQVVSTRLKQQRRQEEVTTVQKQDEVMDKMRSVDVEIMEADDDYERELEAHKTRMELPKRQAAISGLLDFQGEDGDDGSKQDKENEDDVEEEEDDEEDQTGVHKPGQKAQPMA